MVDQWPMERPESCGIIKQNFQVYPSTHVQSCSGWWFQPFQPLWKIWKSVGMMTFPIYGKLKNVPNHQPVFICTSTRGACKKKLANIYTMTWNVQRFPCRLEIIRFEFPELSSYMANPKSPAHQKRAGQKTIIFRLMTTYDNKLWETQKLNYSTNCLTAILVFPDIPLFTNGSSHKSCQYLAFIFIFHSFLWVFLYFIFIGLCFVWISQRVSYDFPWVPTEFPMIFLTSSGPASQ